MKKIAAKMLLLGGLAVLAAAGAGASPASDDVPALSVRYSADMLSTDTGARALYRRLSQAAEQVCPAQPTETRIVNEKVAQCRTQAIAAAVQKIHNQRLAAVYAASAKSG